MKLHITEKALGEIVLPEGARSTKVMDTEVIGFGAQLTNMRIPTHRDRPFREGCDR